MPMAIQPAGYDVFVSYARPDNRGDDHYVERLVDSLERAFRLHTGRDLRLFFDRRNIATAQMWEREIRGALRRSSIMIAILSPAYFKSQWCAREWDFFVRANRDRSIMFGITPYLKLIFPISLIELPGIDHGSPETRRRIREAQAMQHVDFAGVSTGEPEFTTLIRSLVDDVIHALRALDEVTHGQGAWLSTGFPAASAESPAIMTRRAQNKLQFVRVLADAINVTVVGITNRNLARFLSQALELKRRRLGPDAFWDSLRIVFLREDLLDLTNDELEARRPRSPETFRERKRWAKAGKRAVVSFLVRQDQPEKWSLHEYEYYLPFLGGLFSMADGTNLVQITIARPRHSADEAMYFEFVDPADHFFANAFHDIVADSHEDNEVILVGLARDTASFHVNGARFRRSALRKGENLQDWLPSVTIATWTERQGSAIPVLQVRTQENASHYIHYLSHISGYVNENDLISAGHELSKVAESPILLPLEAAHNAAQREVSEQLDLTCRGLKFIRACRYSNHDRESLFFHLFALQLPDSHLYPVGAEIRSCKVSDLIRLHLYQVLCKTGQLLRANDLSPDHRATAAHILACHLTLHGEPALGERLLRAARRPPVRLADSFEKLADRNVVRWRLDGRDVVLGGLAEVHYREFFSTLLRLYASVGVADAARAVHALNSTDAMREAERQLAEAYSDDDLMWSLPFEA
jgi:TIR domain